MYTGLAFSPQAQLANPIGASDTIIPVNDISLFPEGPNYATISGADGYGETILYTTTTGNSLSGCVRGVEGEAKAWEAGEAISRNWTAVDHDSLISNINELNQKKLENEKFKLERKLDKEISKERFKIVQQTEELEKNLKSQKELRNEKNKIIST